MLILHRSPNAFDHPQKKQVFALCVCVLSLPIQVLKTATVLVLPEESRLLSNKLARTSKERCMVSAHLQHVAVVFFAAVRRALLVLTRVSLPAWHDITAIIAELVTFGVAYNAIIKHTRAGW